MNFYRSQKKKSWPTLMNSTSHFHFYYITSHWCMYNGLDVKNITLLIDENIIYNVRAKHTHSKITVFFFSLTFVTVYYRDSSGNRLFRERGSIFFIL